MDKKTAFFIANESIGPKNRAFFWPEVRDSEIFRSSWLDQKLRRQEEEE